MNKDILLLYNPKAGDTFFRFELENFLEVFSRSGSTVRIFTSQFEGDMGECIRNTHLNEIDLVIVAGGDGSVNDVVQAMMEYDQPDRPPLGIIPAGTRNEIAKYLEMPEDYRQCIEILYRGRTEEVNIGEVNHRFFMNRCGFGSMINVFRNTSQEMKNTFGKIAYYFNGLFHRPKEQPFHLTIQTENESFEDDFIMFLVVNSDGSRMYHSGLPLAPDENRSLQFIGIKNASRFSNQKVLIRSLHKIPVRNRNIVRIKADTFDVCCDHLPAGMDTCFVDGEKGPDFPLHFSIHRKALQIITNRNVPRGTIRAGSESDDPV